MRVRDLMTRGAVTVGPGEGLDRAVTLMRDRNCGCLPVVDETSEVVGIITDRDVCLAALRAGSPLARLMVGDAMTRRVHTCRTEDSIEQAEETMSLRQVRRLPVIDRRGRLAGIISLDDIARASSVSDTLIASPVSPADVGRTLGQICRPHLLGAE